MDFIKKYQEGGYVTYRPIPITPQQVQSPAVPPETPEAKDEGLDKEVLKKMVGEGITTDVMAYSQQVNSAYQQYAMMDDNMKNSFRGRQLRLVMKGDLGQLNALARGKKYLDQALENADKNGALDEAAVTADGVVVKDASTGRISTMSFGQYAKAKGDPDNKFQTLTNAQLAEEREMNPQLLGNSTVFSIIKYATGMEKIKEEVYKVLPTLGSISVTKSSGAFGGSIGGDQGEGDSASALEQAAASGAFKIKDGTTYATNVPAIEKAKHDLWNSLSPGAKATLRMKAATLVDDPGQIDQAAASLAANLLDPKQTTISKEIHDETYKKMGKGAGGDKEDPVGPNEAAFNFRLHNTSVAITGPHGAKINSMGSVLPVDNYQAADGKRTTLQDATSIAKIADVHNAFTVNGDKVDPKRTMINGRMYFTYLPLTVGEDGTQKVDEAGAAKWAQVQHDHPGESPAELARTYGVQLNVKPVVVGEAVSFSDSKFHWFDGRDNNYYTPADDQTEKYAREIIDPKHKDVAGMIDHTAHTHLIIMNAGSESEFRDSDNNKVYAPKSAFDIRTYNTGPNGANIEQGQPIYQPQTAANLGTGYLNQ
jgi:hypothetical protein